MNKIFNKGLLFSALILLSAALYMLHFEIFKDAHHIFIYLLGDIAFLPLEVLFVTLIFHKVLEDMEKKNGLKKINMIISVFFCETGAKLLKLLIPNDAHLNHLQSKLLFNNHWKKKDFRKALQSVEKHQFSIQMTNYQELKQLLLEDRDLLLKIIENPMLLEHDLFSELMLGIFHLEEELHNRSDVNNLCENDQQHIDIDIARVYKLLIRQWVLYIQHLKNEYPYLYSFAVRTNPFDQDAKVEIS
jgi:hypothetical protein